MAWACCSKRSHGMRVPPSLPTLQIWPLRSIPDHTRPRYGSRAAAAFAGKGVDPSRRQQLVWHRETDRTFRVTGQTIWIKRSVGGKGLELRTILILTIFLIVIISQDETVWLDMACAMSTGQGMHKRSWLQTSKGCRAS